jgi:hypothetical protein
MDSLAQVLKALPLDQVIHWGNVSKQPLSETFIDDNHEFLDWNTLSACQPLAPWIADKYKDKINWMTMSSNKTLPPETIAGFIDRMDLETSQKNHRYTDDMVRAWKEDLDPMVMMQYQKLGSAVITELIELHVSASDWRSVVNLANAASQYQVLDTTFYETLLGYEDKIVQEVGTSEQMYLFNRQTVLQYQKTLPEKFILDRIVAGNSQLRITMLENFPCSDTVVLTSIVHTPELMNYNRILKVQRLCEAVLLYILELHDNNANLIRLIVRYQTFDIEFLETLSKSLQPDEITDLYNTVFVRCLKPTSDTFLTWNSETVNTRVVPKTNFARVDLRENLPEFVNFAISNLKLFAGFSWYNFIGQYVFKDDQMTQFETILDPLEFWYAMNKNRSYLSKVYWTRNEPKLSWWRQIPSALMLDFATRCIECPTDSDLYRLLEHFVGQTKWSEFLSVEKIPEWFIDVLDRFRQPIERNLRTVSYWWKIGRHQTLSPAFIDCHINALELKNILCWQRLTDDQLERYCQAFDVECWYFVTKHQTPSSAFLARHAAEMSSQ